MLLIGSRALQYYDFTKDPKDTDLIGSYHEIHSYFKSFKNIRAQYPLNADKVFMQTSDGHIFEAEIAWSDSTAKQLIELVKAEKGLITKEGFLIPSLDLLYALKLSHRYLKNSPHFLKTMQDIRMLRNAGASIRHEHMEWFKAREKATYTYAHPKLNQAKDTFFNPNEGVTYVYDHDSIHQAVKTFEKPAYSYFKPDESEVLTSRKMFFECPEKIQLAAVLEESYVLALERSQIPYPQTDRKKSFDIALEKVCTSITSGWFREYSWESYEKVQDLYDPNYVEVFKEGVDKGIVKPFEQVE